jgi:RNA polymerase sigma factor (sigma-70 family)
MRSSARIDFDTFFASSCSDMLARAMVLSGNRHDAEDAVQEAYLEALSRWDRISGYDNPGAWVYKIVRQRLWKASKRWARLRSLGSAESAARRAVDGDPEQFTEAAMALSALAALPDRQRMVMVMHCLHQMEQKQIADELGLTRSAVAASIFKARRKMEKALGMKDTALSAIAEPGSSIVTAESAPDNDQTIVRRRDPLVAYVDAAMSLLRQRAAVADSGLWLERIHRKAQSA